MTDISCTAGFIVRAYPWPRTEGAVGCGSRLEQHRGAADPTRGF